MSYTSVVILIPSHSLEDFPTDLGDKDAAGLLNAFCVPWHPVLFAETKAMPTWHRSDEPPEPGPGQLVFVPSACKEQLPGGWSGHARLKGSVVIDGQHDRQEMLRAALAPLGPDRPAVDPDLVADFLALGTAWLQMELLTRHMHYFSNIDEALLQRSSAAAADAALAGDHEAAKTHLKAAFETLLENRERFYPVECYLLDLCLVIPRLADEHLASLLAKRARTNFLLAAEDLELIARDKPELTAVLRESWAAGTADLVGGEWRETPSTILPPASVLWNFARGRESIGHLLGRTPRTWGRRRYGVSPLLPQILLRSGCHSALHLAMDDGLYPDAEQSKTRWEGADGSVIDAVTRIPLAADGAGSFLRFPVRLAESMEGDHVAAVILARWPEVKSPWLEDLRRIHEYAPVFGRFVTFDEFVSRTETPGRISKFEAREYLTPYFIQSVARREPDPVTRVADHLRRRTTLDAAATLQGIADLLRGRPVRHVLDDEAIRLVEETGIDLPTEPSADQPAPDAARLDAAVAEAVRGAAQAFADLVVAGSGGNEPGWIVANPLAFSRRMAVDLPEAREAPAVGGPVKAVQFDGVRRQAVVEVPGCGFAWIPDAGSKVQDRRASPVPLAEENVLRNDYFEVCVSNVTGGIREIKGHGRSPKRLSQQLAFRFGRERYIPAREDRQEERTAYSEMVCRSLEASCDGPAVGEIVTTGDLVDQSDDKVLAKFRQTVRVYRARPVVEIDLELEPERLPEGDPWSNYYAARFAWNDAGAVLTRSMQLGAHRFQGERIESPHFLEIASDAMRTTILPCGLPYHRKTGMRMLDSILIAEGETRRRFRFVIAIDEQYPAAAAVEALVPQFVARVTQGPPRSGATGWLFHLDARNVQWLGIVGPAAEPFVEPESWAAAEDRTWRPKPLAGATVRLAETEGRSKQARLRCFANPRRARQVDLQGGTLADLKLEGDAVLVPLGPYEIVDVEVVF